MKKNEFRVSSLRDQLEFLRVGERGFGVVCPEQYRRFLKKTQLASYEQVKKLSEKIRVTDNAKNRRVVARMLLEMRLAEANILYFDSTSISDQSFRQKAWTLSAANGTLKTGQQFRSLKVLVVFSEEGIEGLEFIHATDSEKIAIFLSQVIKRLMSAGQRAPFVIFLDNAKPHKSQLLTQLTISLDIILFFNAIQTPELNLIEHFFEYLKRPLRMSFNMCPYNSISAMLKQAKRFKMTQMKCCLKRQFKALARILLEE